MNKEELIQKINEEKLNVNTLKSKFDDKLFILAFINKYFSIIDIILIAILSGFSLLTSHSLDFLIILCINGLIVENSIILGSYIYINYSKDVKVASIEYKINKYQLNLIELEKNAKIESKKLNQEDKDNNFYLIENYNYVENNDNVKEKNKVKTKELIRMVK